MMLLIYSKYGWGVYEKGQEQLKRVMESRLVSVTFSMCSWQVGGANKKALIPMGGGGGVVLV